MIGDVSLYFHIPFCTKKCPYCHFFVLPDQPQLKEQFLSALALEWQMRLPLLRDKRIVSIYFGGGTPSRLSPAQIGSLLEMIHSSNLLFSSTCEITLEVNPEDATSMCMQEYKALGINRISFGIQSLDDTHLLQLGRGHSANKGIQAIACAHTSGLTNISIDLMYDLPHQTRETWEKTLTAVSLLPITHLSLYNLTLEPHTVFFQKKSQLIPLQPTPELSLHILERALAHFAQEGLERYEISAFARAGYHSRHNTGYWTGRPFLGFGPSAYSYWDHQRMRNIAHLNRYSQALEEQRSPVDFTEKLDYPRRLAELLAVQLRMTEGVDLAHFEARYGPLPPVFEAIFMKLKDQGWLEQEGALIRLSEKGMLFYDSVAVELV